MNTIFSIMFALLALSIATESLAKPQYRTFDFDEPRRKHKNGNRNKKPCRRRPKDAEGRTFFDINLSYVDVNQNYICGNQYPIFGPGPSGGGNHHGGGHGGGGHHGGGHGGGGHHGGQGGHGGGYPYPGGGGYYPPPVGGGYYPPVGAGGFYPGAGGGGYPGGGGFGGGRPPLSASNDQLQLGCGLFGQRPCRPSAIRPINFNGGNGNNDAGGSSGGNGINFGSALNQLGSVFGDNPLGSIGNQLGSFFSRPQLGDQSSSPAEGGGNNQVISEFLDTFRPSNIQSAFQNTFGNLFDGSLINQFFGGGNNQPAFQRPPTSSPTASPPISSGDEDKPIHQDYDEVLPDDPQNLKPENDPVVNKPIEAVEAEAYIPNTKPSHHPIQNDPTPNSQTYQRPPQNPGGSGGGFFFGLFDGSIVNGLFGGGNNPPPPPPTRPETHPQNPSPTHPQNPSSTHDIAVHEDNDEVYADDYKPGLPPRTPFKDY